MALATIRSTSPAAAAVRTALVLLALWIPFLAATPRMTGTATEPSSSLVELLRERHGLEADVASVHWLEPPGRGIFNDWTVSRVVVVARQAEDGLRDLFLVRARVSPSGRVLGARPINLTRSFNASERAFVARGATLVAGIMVDGRYVALEAFDFRGEDPSLVKDWPLVERLKGVITNLQKTGQSQGIARVRYELVQPSETLNLGFAEQDVVAVVSSGTLRIRPGTPEPVQGQQLAVVTSTSLAMSGHVAWMVDTVRAIPMIGPEKIGWMEAKFYNLKDVFMRSFYSVAGNRYAERELQEDMAVTQRKPYVLELPEEMGQMELSWPPPPVPPHPEMEPMENEGKWSAFGDEVFTRRDPGHPLPFYTTFLRPDPDRPYANLTMVAWDPRMVEIHMQAGVVEPISDTGKAGTGLIPRDDETMMRLLAAFNGGFQALHGEFGMMQDGKVYLPPKPWAATVARLRGGRIGFGTWPGPEVGDIPPEILSYRQNLTPLIQDSEINPYRRTWWGSSPDLNPDSPKINRSGICWTEDGHILYALARAVDEYGFAEGFKRAGCHYLIQLDVNSGHSGFEYYRVDPEDDAPDLGEAGLDKKAEAQGAVRDRPDLIFRARKLFRSMVLMRFPRFIQRDPRDYFYLTLARNLPGPPVQVGTGQEAENWKVKGLPGSQTYPARFTMVTLRDEEGYGDPVHVVQADPRWLFVIPITEAEPEATGAVWFPPESLPGHNTGSAKALQEGDLVIAFTHDPYGDEWMVSSGRWIQEIDPNVVQYAFQVLDEQTALDGGTLCGAFGLNEHRFLSWAETPGGEASRIVEGLRAAGATTILGVPSSDGETCGWAFDYGPEPQGKNGLIPLVAEALTHPDGTGLWGLSMHVFSRDPAVRLFPDTSVVLPRVWNPGQIKRIRYFRPQEKDDESDEDS